MTQGSSGKDAGSVPWLKPWPRPRTPHGGSWGRRFGWIVSRRPTSLGPGPLRFLRLGVRERRAAPREVEGARRAREGGPRGRARPTLFARRGVRGRDRLRRRCAARGAVLARLRRLAHGLRH